MAQPPVMVFIVDDQPLFRKGLRECLSEAEDITVVGECTVSEEAIELVDGLAPNIVIMDTASQDHKGLELARRLSQRSPSTAVILMTPAPDDTELFEAMRIGAEAYLSKQATAKELITIVRRIHNGDFPLHESLISHPRVAERVLTEFQSLAQTQPLDGLTAPLSRREMDVLGLIRDGCINKEIAQRLCVTEQTVKSHVTSILRKLNVNDRTQAVLTAVRQGWMTLQREEQGQTDQSQDGKSRKALIVVWGDSFIKLWLPTSLASGVNVHSASASQPANASDTK